MVDPNAADKNTLHDLGYKIFLDRYALKDMTRASLSVGDTVIVVVDSKTGQREVGTVTAMDLPSVTIKLLDGETVTRDLEHVDKPLETNPGQMMDRVARGIADIETTDAAKAEWAKKFRWLLDGWKFVPGGRILAGAGTDQQLTYYNCMPPEQEVLTADGYRPIADVSVGDRVVTHRNRLRKVTHKFERQTQEPLYTFSMRKLGFDDLRVTGDHKVLVIRSESVNKHRSRDGLRLSQEPQWIPAKELRVGDFLAAAHDGDVSGQDVLHVSDYVGHGDYPGRPAGRTYEVRDGWLNKPRVTPNGTTVIGKPTAAVRDALVIDEPLMELFGRWLGDGCVTHRTGTQTPSGIKIVFGLDEHADAEVIAAIIEDKFGAAPSIKVSSNGRWLDLWVNVMPVGEFFAELFGRYSHGKTIPADLMRQPDPLITALLRGLFRADGYTSGQNVGMLLANRTLAVQVHQLLLRLGYFFSIFENTLENGRTEAFRVTAGLGEASDLYERFFDRSTPDTRGFRSHLEYDGLKWVRIETITTSVYTGTVMDIEVEDDHSFVSAGVVVSNCYVIPSPRDSRGGIMETLSQMTEIMSRGGGVGINISSLRPRHAYVKGVNGRSSGAVSWGALYSFVTGLIEQGGCFGPDERIATDKGLIPASELADRIDSGETFLAQTHKGWRPITMRFRNGEKPLYEVRTKRGFSLRITQEHKVAVMRAGDVTTVPLSDLQPGDEILLLLGGGSESTYVALKPIAYDRSIMSMTLNTDVTLPTYLTEDIAYFLGYLHADGYVHVGKKVTWSAPKALKLATADAHPSIRERLDRIVKTQFGLTAVHEQGDGAVVNLGVYCRLLIEWLRDNGLLKDKSELARVPEAIFRSPSSVMGAFIAGYFDADGCNRGKKGGFGIDSVSRTVLSDMQQLLAFNGIVSRISTTDRVTQGWRPIHRLIVAGAQFKARFAAFVPAEKISGIDSSKRDMYNTYPADARTTLGARSQYRQRIYDGVSARISHGQLTAIQSRLSTAGETALADVLGERMNVMPDMIEAITPIGRCDVYDFEVDDVHLLAGSGIYTSNSRRGALMLILNDWHPDVFNFISSKRQAGQITNANISVGVSDKLMDAIKVDGDWMLQFPDTSDPAYDTEWDGNLEKWLEAGRKTHIYKTVKAREIWDAIIESAWASAEPGVWFRERSNKLANSWYFNPLISTNPCFTGETRVHTTEGLVKARDLWDDETDIGVAVDSRFGIESRSLAASRVFMTGVKPVFKLETDEGYSVRATADHRFMTPRGWVELRDLRPGDLVHVLNRKGTFGRHGSLELGRVLGWLVGDGTIKADRAVLSFFGDEKRELAPLFAEYVNTVVQGVGSRTGRTYPVGVVEVADRDEARVQSERLRQLAEKYGLTEDKFQVPEVVFRGTEEMQRGFLQALFTADGGVQQTIHKATVVRLASSHLALLEQVQILLANFGIVTRLYANRREAQQRMMPDGHGGQKLYDVKAQHELAIAKQNVVRFQEEIGFLLERKNQSLRERLSDCKVGPRAERFMVHVESVTPDGEEAVYDLTEPVTHSVVVNGLITHQCGEQPLGAFSVCNLGAINLAKFYDGENHDVAWDDLANAVRYAVRFLDNVIDSTPYFFEENARVQGMERRVGLGTMGIAELMIHLQVRYGSPESEAFIDTLYNFICVNAYDESVEIAKVKGAFSAFDAEKFLQSGFIQTLPEALREKIRAHGIRNVTLLTQAPTGTTGTLVNTSTGIEPFFSWVYYRKSRLGLHEEKVPIVQQWLDANPDKTDKDLPEYFATAMDLTPEEHVRVQAAFQRWIDSAISKTCNVPNEYTVEQVSELYKLMYELGCKGGTIYRDGSRDEQVLMLKGDERAEKEMEKRAKAESTPEAEALAALTTPVTQVTTPHRVYPRPSKLFGVTVKVATPFGTAYVNMNVDENGSPFEVFITAPGKAGSDLQADAEGLGRLITLSLRTTDPHNRREMLRLIIEQLRDIGGARVSGFGPNRVTSVPDAVARALEDHFFNVPQPAQLSLPLGPDSGGEPAPVKLPPVTGAGTEPKDDPAPVLAFEQGPEGEQPQGYTNGHRLMGADMCPSCRTISLIRTEGCRKCLTCGYSEC